MGAGDTEESCLLMTLIILFLVSCQNLKHKSQALKGSKQKGALRGQEDLDGSVPWGAHVCTEGCVHRKTCLLLPTGRWRAQQVLPYSDHSRAPKAALHPPERVGRLRVGTGAWATWVPSQLFVKAQPATLGKAGKPRRCLCPIEAGCLQPLHLCSPPSPL